MKPYNLFAGEFFKRISLYVLVLIPAAAICQTKRTSCEKLKNGTFYLYPSDINKRYQAVRKGSIQIETDLDTGDTAILKIEWPRECTYTLQYVSGTKQRSKEEDDFWASHKITFDIVETGKDFYIFKGYVEDEPSFPTLQDTIWLKLPAYKTSFPSTFNPPASKYGQTSNLLPEGEIKTLLAEEQLSKSAIICKPLFHTWETRVEYH